jgi:hypothetical protein
MLEIADYEREANLRDWRGGPRRLLVMGGSVGRVTSSGKDADGTFGAVRVAPPALRELDQVMICPELSGQRICG